MRFFRFILPPVNRLYCSVKNSTLKAISALALYSTAISPNSARHRGSPRNVQLG